MFLCVISQKDTKSAGCYNSDCAGFVPAKGAALVPGQAVAPPSIYGEADHYARISLNEVPPSVLVDTNTSLRRSHLIIYTWPIKMHAAKSFEGKHILLHSLLVFFYKYTKYK
jgi:hypothetical protein